MPGAETFRGRRLRVWDAEELLRGLEVGKCWTS
jgi:hypothetical protein